MFWKLAAFDWDGTLVDTAHVAYQAMQTVFTHYNAAAPSKEDFFRNITSGGLENFYHERGIPRFVTRKELNDHWKKYFGKQKGQDGIVMRDGARELLHACRNSGIKVSIVSGSVRNVIEASLTTLGIAGLIDHLEADAHGKVDELRRVIKHFSFEPKEVVYVDDMFEGISAAKNVGAAAIGIRGGFGADGHLREAAPDHLIASLHELIPLFLTVNRKIEQ